MKGNRSDIYQNLILLMIKARGRMNELCENRNLTPVQAILLIVMRPGDAKTMNELSEIMSCDASNVTGLIDRLESNDLIERIADEQDRRVKIIRLSDKGKKCREFLLEGLQDAAAIDLSVLTGEERENLQKILIKLLD